MSVSESKTCGACGAKYYGSPCPLCNVKVRPRADALQAPLADPGISPAQLKRVVEATTLGIENLTAANAQLREKVEALECVMEAMSLQLQRRIEQLERTNESLLDPVAHRQEALPDANRRTTEARRVSMSFQPDKDGYLSPEDTARSERMHDNHKMGIVTLEDAQTFIDMRRMWPDVYPMVDRLSPVKVRDWMLKRGEEAGWGAYSFAPSELEALCAPPKAECQHEWGSLTASYGSSRRCVKCNHVEPLPPKAEGT